MTWRTVRIRLSGASRPELLLLEKAAPAVAELAKADSLLLMEKTCLMRLVGI